MIDWQPAETAPTSGARYLIGSFPKGAMSIGLMNRPNKDDFTTLDGTYHAPTHWAALNTPEEAGLYPNWHQEAKENEQAFMSAKDEYAEVARVLGFTEDTWFGDPLAGHAEIVARAKAAYEALISISPQA